MAPGPSSSRHSHRVGEPQGAGARLPGVYFQRGLFFAVACYYFCARRRGRSVARRSSCVARALRGGLWRRRFCQSGRRVARREVVALRGGLWRRRRFCQSASRARSGAVCGGGGGLWREEVAALRGGLWRRRRFFDFKKQPRFCSWSRQQIGQLRMLDARTAPRMRAGVPAGRAGGRCVVWPAFLVICLLAPNPQLELGRA